MIYHQKTMTNTNPPTDDAANDEQLTANDDVLSVSPEELADEEMATTSADDVLAAAAAEVAIADEPAAAEAAPANEAGVAEAPAVEVPAAEQAATEPVAESSLDAALESAATEAPVQTAAPEVQAAPAAEVPATPPATPAQAAVASAAQAGEQKHILIVEDERPLAHALELKLGHDGYQTTTARTGTEGLKEAQSGNYDLILLDLILPELDGFAILTQLRSENNTIPVVILSNLGQEEDKQRVAQLSVSQYCVKSNMPLAAIVNAVKTHAV